MYSYIVVEVTVVNCISNNNNRMIIETNADFHLLHTFLRLYVLLKVGLRVLNCVCYTLGSDLPGKAGEVDQSDVPGTWGHASGGPHVWSGLPSVRYLWHTVHHDTEAVSLGQWPTWKWVVSDSKPWLCNFLKCSVTRLTVFNLPGCSISCSIWREITKHKRQRSRILQTLFSQVSYDI